MKNFVSAAFIAALLFTGCNPSQKEIRTYQVNDKTSVAEWKGSTPDNSNEGAFQVSGSVQASSDGTIQGGKFIIPIASIKNYNLPDEVKGQLLEHLKSPDFFNMALHPNAAFEITKIEAYNGQEGVKNANQLVTGNFTLAGQTHPITFPASITYAGDSLKVASTFKLDRTKWGLTKYNDPKEKMYILPDADISLKLQAAVQ